MNARVSLRWTSALILFPAFVLASVFMLSTGHTRDPYAAQLVSDTDLALRVLAPLCAGVSAYLTAGISRFVEEHAVTRSWWSGVLTMVWPVVTVAIVVYLGLQATGLMSLGVRPDLRALLMLLSGVASLCMWGLIGMAVGSLRIALLAPVVAVVCHLFYAFLPSLTTPWPRLLTGVQVGCCTLDNRPSLGMIGVGLVTTLLLAGAAVATGLAQQRRAVVLSAGLVMALSAASVLAAAGPYRGTFLMQEPRPDETLCMGEAPRTCVWPEWHEDLPHVAATLAQAQTRLTARGAPPLLPTISDFSANPTLPGLGYMRGANDSQVVANAAYATLTARAGSVWCADIDLAAASLSFALLAGASPEELGVGGGVDDALPQGIGRTERERLGLVQRAMDTPRGCQR